MKLSRLKESVSIISPVKKTPDQPHVWTIFSALEMFPRIHEAETHSLVDFF